MIPKIIHYCWLSGDPFPTDIQACLDTWKKYLPDYEIWLWDTQRFNVNSTTWTKQAFEAKKYAFAADYIRLYDSDVVMYKSFNDLLDLPYFIGHDQIRGFEAAVIGAEKGCVWIKEMMDTYKDKSFIKEDSCLDTLPLPCRFHHVLVEKGYRFTCLHKKESYQLEEKHLYIFDGDFFNSRNTIEVRQTPKSYCAHNYAGSWQESDKEKKSIKDCLPKWLLKTIYKIGQKTWARKKYAWFQIPFEN
jgi:hypothetical protein